jgi:hypothetical protein
MSVLMVLGQHSWHDDKGPDTMAVFQDTSLLPDEDPDLTREILGTIGEEWLKTKNIWLEGRAPYDLIGTPEEFRVRDLLRSIKAAALS